MRRRSFLGLAPSMLACAGRAGAAEERPIVVVSNGWHTGIVLVRDDVPRAEIPETEDFPTAAHYEFGWGDAEYYPAREPSFAMALRAATPGPAVVHLVGLHDEAARVFPTAETIAVPLDATAKRRLVAFIAASFARPPGARATAVAPGLYRDSRFYPATGRFHLFNTCNTWTARALAAAGVKIEPDGVQTADELMARLRAATGAGG